MRFGLGVAKVLTRVLSCSSVASGNTGSAFLFGAQFRKLDFVSDTMGEFALGESSIAAQFTEVFESAALALLTGTMRGAGASPVRGFHSGRRLNSGILPIGAIVRGINASKTDNRNIAFGRVAESKQKKIVAQFE